MDNLVLKPCPFCGSTDIAIVKQDNPHNDYDGDYPYLYTAACKQCLSRSPQKVYEKYAAEAWNTRTSGWIPCSERMPEMNEAQQSECVLVWALSDNWMGMAYFIGDGWAFADAQTMPRLDMVEITHWMPLPEPPEDPR